MLETTPDAGEGTDDLPMNDPSTGEITDLLVAWNNGDRSALDSLMPLVYSELRRLAQRQMRSERPDHTLQATILVNDLYLRLVDQRQVNWKNRAHFFGVASRVVRRILVDHARTRQRLKRGGGVLTVTLSDAVRARDVPQASVLDVDDALNRLAELDPQQSRIVELRFFTGLTIEETAEVLGISPATVKREWIVARAWLYKELVSDALAS